MDNVNWSEIIKDKNADTFINKYLEEVNQKEIQKQQFKENNQDEIVMEKIYTHLKESDSYIDDENMHYHQEKYNFSCDEFNILFNNLEKYAHENYRFKNDEEGYGVYYYLKYKDMKIDLSIIVGQGSIVSMSECSDENWNEDKSFTWEQYKENYEFDLTEIKRKMLHNDLNDFIQQMQDKLDLSYDEVLDELGNYIKERITL